MAHDSGFIERIKDYRSRSESARAVEEKALLRSMTEMGTILGDLQAFRSASTSRLPVTIHSARYVSDITELDDGMNGIHVLVHRDEDKVSRVSTLIRTEKYEEEKVVTIAPRRVDGVKCWIDETYRRSPQNGTEVLSKDSIYTSAEQAAYVIRSAIVNGIVQELSYGQAFLNDSIPTKDLEAAAAISMIVEKAQAVGADVERNRRIRKDERYRTVRALTGIWDMAKAEIGFLSELGFDFNDSEKELSLTAFSDSSSLTIKTVHSFGYETAIKIEVMDSSPDHVLVSGKDSFGRDEHIAEYSVSDVAQLKETIVANILTEIEESEKIWVPEEELDYAPQPTMA